MAGEIRNLEVLSAGTWNASTGTVTVTESHLDEMVKAFNALKGSNIVKPHLKLGHTDAQRWFGQKDGIPTLGWITNIWRVGKKLLADVAEVPDYLLSMIRAGRYHNVSSEFFLGMKNPIEYQGNKFSSVLSAVALLGVEMPAAKDLAGLAEALFSEQPPSLQEDGAFLVKMRKNMPDPDVKVMFTQEQLDTLVKASVDKAVAETKAAMTQELQSKTSELDVVTKARDGLQAQLDAVKQKAADMEIDTLIESAIKDGRMLPKQKDSAKLLLTASANAKIKASDGSEKSVKQLFADFLEASGKQVKLGEQGSGSGSEGRSDFANAADELDTKVRAAIKADKTLKYGDAMQQVLESDPDLRQRYAAITN